MVDRLNRNQIEDYLDELKRRTMRKIRGKDVMISEVHAAMQKAKSDMRKERLKSNPIVGMCSRCENCKITYEARYGLKKYRVARCMAVQIKSKSTGETENKKIQIISSTVGINGGGALPFKLKTPPTWCPKRNDSRSLHSGINDKLPVRTSNAIVRYLCRTENFNQDVDILTSDKVFDLYNSGQLSKIKGLGSKSMRNIVSVLKELGYEI